MVDERPAEGGGQVAEAPVERFRPTSGGLAGYTALALVAGVLVVAVVDRGIPAPVVWASLLFGSLVWASMLRPALWVTPTSLVMRNMLHTVSIPLAAIEQIAVRQVLAVRAGDRRFVSPAIGRSWRQNLKAGTPEPDEPTDPASTSYAEFVEQRLHHVAEEARAKAGVALMSDEQLALATGVRRAWAWPEIALLAVTLCGTVVSLMT